MADEDEEWKKLEKPDLNWDKMQRILWNDMKQVDVNIREATLQRNAQMLLALSGVRAQLITALASCESNRASILFPKDTA